MNIADKFVSSGWKWYLLLGSVALCYLWIIVDLFQEEKDKKWYDYLKNIFQIGVFTLGLVLIQTVLMMKLTTCSKELYGCRERLTSLRN